MRSLFAVIVTFLTVSAQAQSIVIRASGSSPAKFNDFMRSRSDATSFIDHTQWHLQKNTLQEDKLFQLADLNNQNSSAALQLIKQIQSEAPLTLTSLRYVRDLTDRLLEQKNSTAVQLELLHTYCKAAALLNEGPALRSCASQVVSLKQIAKKFPTAEKVLVESLSFAWDDNLALSPKTAYQWTLLSNAHTPVHFFGTFDQLINQHFAFENLIEGSCDGFSSNVQDFEAGNRGVVFFNDTCLRKITTASDKGSWIEENKPLLYTAGAIILGSLIVASAKGKRLDWSKTALK
ncbi:MAG: hypothetical protein HUU57_01490 [Bdellovibrio sp.]|nr:hypothetical protein [Bdellovibrio sp.]